MIVKHIKLNIRKGHMQAFLESQKIWNRETEKAEGFIGGFCGARSEAPQVVHIFLYWKSRENLDRWMRTDHDRIAALSDSQAHYDGIEVHILEDLLDEERMQTQ